MKLYCGVEGGEGRHVVIVAKNYADADTQMRDHFGIENTGADDDVGYNVWCLGPADEPGCHEIHE